MPIYEYITAEDGDGCDLCRQNFDHTARISDPLLKACPRCGKPVRRAYSPPAIGRSASGLDDRAKRAGFHKLERLGKGEYEKKY